MSDKEENAVNSAEILPKVNGVPFQKGDDPRRNTAGKPKGTKHFATIFAEILKEEIELKGVGKMTMSKAMAMAMARKAIRGDVSAFNAVSDRVDGKAQQKVELEAELTMNEGLTKEQKEGLLKLLDNNGI